MPAVMRNKLDINTFCVTFLMFGERKNTLSFLATNRNLSGVNIPPLSFACIFSETTKKPSPHGKRHYIGGKELSIDEAREILTKRSIPLAYGAHLVLENMERESWKRAVLTRLIPKPFPQQMIFGFSEGESIINPPRTFPGGKVLTPEEALHQVQKSCLPSVKKREISRAISNGRWEKVVRVNSGFFTEFRDGDQVVPLV